eukprot:1158120-Pelagomonas_calceolata.AAC.11
MEQEIQVVLPPSVSKHLVVRGCWLQETFVAESNSLHWLVGCLAFWIVQLHSASTQGCYKSNSVLPNQTYFAYVVTCAQAGCAECRIGTHMLPHMVPKMSTHAHPLMQLY